MLAPAESKSKTDDEERCGKCGRLIFKVFHERNYVFVEIKCKDCSHFVIRKFLAYEKKVNGGSHA